jgi:hypothetical protein
MPQRSSKKKGTAAFVHITGIPAESLALSIGGVTTTAESPTGPWPPPHNRSYSNRNVPSRAIAPHPFGAPAGRRVSRSSPCTQAWFLTVDRRNAQPSDGPGRQILAHPIPHESNVLAVGLSAPNGWWAGDRHGGKPVARQPHGRPGNGGNARAKPTGRLDRVIGRKVCTTSKTTTAERSKSNRWSPLRSPMIPAPVR